MVKMVIMLLVLSACAIGLGACDDGPGMVLSDASTDTDADSDSDGDSDSDTDPVNPCDEGQHAECYGEEVWCFEEDTPVTQLDVCDVAGGESCVQLTDDVAECQCESDVYRQCYNGDVWAYDSCGEFDFMVLDCEDSAECEDISGTEADCCETHSYQECGADDNVHWMKECELTADQDEAIAEDCPVNAECVPGSPPGCVCRNHWEGADCTTCPGNWDPDQDCGACGGEWTGTNCETCSGGYGDRCQCPDDTFVPQPGTLKCWTCPNGLDANGGICDVLDTSSPTVAEAEALCLAGFSLPKMRQIAGLVEDCVPLGGDFYDCSACVASAPCDDMYGLNIGWVWAFETCVFSSEDGHYFGKLFSVSADVTTSSQNCFPDDYTDTDIYIQGICVR